MPMTVTTTGTGLIPADTFANRLILSRALAGHLSIREAAEKCGLGRGAWQNWEKGARPDDYDGLVDLIAARLGVDRHWLAAGGGLSAAAEQTRPARWARSLRRGDTETSHRSLPTRPQRRPTDRRPAGRPAASTTRPSGQRRTSLVA